MRIKLFDILLNNNKKVLKLEKEVKKLKLKKEVLQDKISDMNNDFLTRVGECMDRYRKGRKEIEKDNEINARIRANKGMIKAQNEYKELSIFKDELQDDYEKLDDKYLKLKDKYLKMRRKDNETK